MRGNLEGGGIGERNGGVVVVGNGKMSLERWKDGFSAFTQPMGKGRPTPTSIWHYLCNHNPPNTANFPTSFPRATTATPFGNAFVPCSYDPLYCHVPPRPPISTVSYSCLSVPETLYTSLSQHFPCKHIRTTLLYLCQIADHVAITYGSDRPLVYLNSCIHIRDSILDMFAAVHITQLVSDHPLSSMSYAGQAPPQLVSRPEITGRGLRFWPLPPPSSNEHFMAVKLYHDFAPLTEP